LVRDEAPAGTAQNRATRARRERPVDEAVYYRARLILGDGLARPGR